jgi:hypothetical protein
LDQRGVREICLGSECHCLAAYINQSAGAVVWPGLKRDLAVERNPQLASFFDEHEQLGCIPFRFALKQYGVNNILMQTSFIRGVPPVGYC